MNRSIKIFALLLFSINAYTQNIQQIRATCKARINSIDYKAICFDDEHILVKNNRGKTILNLDAYDAAGFANFSFTDFDGDGYKDLMIEYMANVPGICNLYLYEKASKSFVKVDGVDRYPAPRRIAGTPIFYSYHRSGCADMNWDSDLFIIKNHKPIKLGNINGNECGDSGIKDGIYIYKCNDDQRSLYKTMPIYTIKGHRDYKWGFIATYWKKNFKEFVINK